MKTIFPKTGSFRALMTVVLVSIYLCTHGQTTVISTQPTFVANNGSGLVTFNFQNTNSYPIIITDISTVLNGAGLSEATLWTRPAPINGAPGAVVSVANGWTQAATQTITSTIGATSNTVAEPVLSNISVIIPPNTTLGMAVGVYASPGASPGRMRYYDIPVNTNPIFSGSGVNIITGNLVSYGSTSATLAPSNHPRGFVGSISLKPAIVGMDNAAVSSFVSPINFCPGNQPIIVQIANGGTNLINNVDVHWELDGVPQTPVNYTTPIDTFGSVSGATANITLGNHVFTSAPVNLTVYTSNPNGVPDVNTGNDTLHITLQAAMSGTYTINSTQPTGGTNYASFAAFTNDLNALGICGPVIANVDAASGPYNEVVRFGTITGSSAINTIKINGNGRWVEYTNSITTANNDRQLLIVDGTKYLSIDSLNFRTLGTVGWGAVYTNGASYDTLTNCVFDLTSITSTATASSNGISFSGTTASPTAPNSGVRHSYIKGNKILGPTGSGGPYHGFTLMGADSNTIEQNEISNFYNYGFFISNCTGSKILENEVHRTTKSSVSSFYGIHTVGTSAGTHINRNRIHTPAGTAATSTSLVYALNITGEATSQNPGLVSNNLVYNINEGGTVYGIQISGAPYNKIYHNTVVIDKTMTGTSVNRGIFATGTNTGVEIKNNIVSITGGSLGIKTGLFYNAANSIGDSQRNHVYVNSTQTGNQFYAAYPAASTFAAMADFQVAYPALEMGSLDGNPLFTNPGTANFLPTLPALGVNGLNLLTDVPSDITGATRKPTPTPGAFEVPAQQGIDGALMAFASPSQTFCEGLQDIKFVAANYGSVQLTNFNINWEINGIPQTPFNYTGVLDTLNGTGNYSDTITIGTSNIAAGNSVIKAWLSITNDLSALNDTIITSISPSNFVITAQRDTVCLGNEATLSISPASGYQTNAINWESSTDGITFTPIPGANTPNYISPPLSDITHYRVFINSGTNGCYSNVQEIIVIDGQILTTTDGTRCGTGTVNISATGTPGTLLNWYANATGGAVLGNGNNFTTPSITSTTNFYVSASTGSAEEIVPSPTAGTSTFITTTLGWGLHFTVNNQTTIKTVDTYPVNTTAGPATIQIRITNINDVVLYTGPVHNFTATTTPSLQTVPVNLPLPPGVYKMGMVYSGINNMVRESGGSTYPYSPPSNSLSITAGANGAGAAQTTASYYWFYNWKLGSGCESPRVAVEAEVVPAPAVQISPSSTTSFCIGDSTQLSIVPETGVTYQWKRGGVDIPGATGTSYYANIQGSYTLEATNTNTNCTATSNPTQINQVNPQAAITAAGPTTFCDGGNVVLSTPQSLTYIYQWALDGAPIAPGGNLASYTASQPGIYKVTVTQFGCVKESNPITITVNQAPTATVTPITSSICDGNTVTLQANTGTGLTYQWQKSGVDISGETASSFTADEAGTYSVIVTGTNSCEQTSGNATVAINPNPTPTITAAGLTLSVGAFATYQWNLNGNPIAGATQQQYTVAQNGDYTVTVTDANGCSGTSTITSIFTVGISEYDQTDEISVFPNPTSGLVQIISANNINIEVTSMDGKTLLIQNNVKTLDISNLVDNVYLLRILDTDGKLIATKRIIKISK